MDPQLHADTPQENIVVCNWRILDMIDVHENIYHI